MLMRENNLWVANAGDSRAVLAKENGDELKAVDLSVDQNPNSPKEQVDVPSLCGETPILNESAANFLALSKHKEDLPGLLFLLVTMRFCDRESWAGVLPTSASRHYMSWLP